MKLAPLSIWLALPILAQTSPVTTTAITISGGNVYQQALSLGIEYVAPVAGQAIINEKAALNIKTILLQGLGTATISTAVAGLTNIITIPHPATVGAMLGYWFYNTWIAPLLSKSAPNPGNLSPVLEVNSTMVATPTTCAENSMYASAIQGTPAVTIMKAKRKGGARTVMPQPVIIGGLEVTYTPQGIQPLKNAAGTAIKDFLVLDVLACMPSTPAVTLKTKSEEIKPQSPVNTTEIINGMLASKVARETPVEPEQSKWESGSSESWRVVQASELPVVRTHPMQVVSMIVPPPPMVKETDLKAVPATSNLAHLSSDERIEALQKQVESLQQSVQRLTDMMANKNVLLSQE